MKSILNWIRNIKPRWIILAMGIFILLLLCERGCRKSTYKDDIKASDKKITVLKKDNAEKDNVIEKSIQDAKAYEAKVKEQEEKLIESEFIIKGLRKERAEVMSVVMELPPSELVEETRKILDCAEIELTEEGILFSIECTQAVLIMAEQFSLMKEELNETRFSLSTSKKATQLQKMATWSVYRIAWAQRSQVLNYQDIIKEKDFQFDLCQKKKKRAWWNGLWKGFVIGVIVTASAKLIFGKLI